MLIIIKKIAQRAKAAQRAILLIFFIIINEAKNESVSI